MTDLALRYTTMNAAANETAQAAGAAQSAPPSTPDQLLAKLYNAKPYSPLPSATGEQVRYGADGGALSDLENHREIGLESWYDALDLVPQERAQMTTALKQIGAEIGFSRGEIGELVSALHAALREPVNDETLDAMNRENARRLSQMHGPSWRDSLADVEKLVAKRPDLNEFLDEFRVKANPRVLDLLISKAHSLKLRGKL